MAASLVLESLCHAFDAAASGNGRQPRLEAQRALQTKLFDDLSATIRTIPSAPDIMTLPHAIGLDYCLTGETVSNWIEAFPDGVLWPITVAAPVSQTRDEAAPFQSLLMVPMSTCSSALAIPRGLLRYMAPRSGMVLNEARTVILLGLFQWGEGDWVYSPIAAVVEVSADGRLNTWPLLLLPEALQRYAAQNNVSEQQATRAIVEEYINDLVGHVLVATLGATPTET